MNPAVSGMISGARLVRPLSWQVFVALSLEHQRILLTLTFPAWVFDGSAVGMSAADVRVVDWSVSNDALAGLPAQTDVVHSAAFLRLLRSLSLADGIDWAEIRALSWIEWHEERPQPCLDTASPRHCRLLTGRLLLPGFEDVDLPGSQDDDVAGVRRANEGECSLNAFGDEKTVHEVVLVKYYPTDNVDGLMSRLLTEALQLQLIGSEGSSAEKAVEFLYRIRFEGSGAVYAAVTNEEGGRRGPGFTTIVLSRNDPRVEGAGSESGQETSHNHFAR
jgi:hypothetical protein